MPTRTRKRAAPAGTGGWSGSHSGTAAALVALLLATSCSATRAPAEPALLAGQGDGTTRELRSELELQSTVMGMADDYGAALGEAMYLIVRGEDLDPRGRWLAQSFLRNGMGAAIDIGAGPNPAVSLLDLLVLTSLQSWAFETHWIPAGLGEAGLDAVERLRLAEEEAWAAAAHELSPDELETLEGLVDHWIEAHPDRTVVSLVRFTEFATLRRLPAVAREAASGLLADVREATAAVEDATLLGERLLWFASRLPYVVGQQTELTAYRLADQPEAALLRDALASLDRLVETITDRVRSLEDDAVAWREEFFAGVRAERAETLEDLAQRVRQERGALTEEFFGRLAAERTALFDELEARQRDVVPVLTEVRDLLVASDQLTRDLTTTVEALDVVVARFDRDPDDVQEPLDIQDVTAAATEASRAAERATVLLERVNETLDSPNWDARLERIDGVAARAVDHAFWRALVLVLVVLGGAALLRFLPRRRR